MNFEDRINSIINGLRHDVHTWSKEERAVMRILVNARDNKVGKITQVEIAQNADWMGCHPKYEDVKRNETTLRKVRQVVRDLRINRGAPILSDDDGYWIPRFQEEIDEYMDRLERIAKAQAASYLETYKAMDSILGVRSKYFETQRGLIDNDSSV